MAFLFGVTSHMAADVAWHSLGIEQGFLRTMGAVSLEGRLPSCPGRSREGELEVAQGHADASEAPCPSSPPSPAPPPHPLLPGLPARSGRGQDPGVHRDQQYLCFLCRRKTAFAKFHAPGKSRVLIRTRRAATWFSSGGTAPRVYSFKIFLSNMQRRVLICVWLAQRRGSSRWAASCVQHVRPPSPASPGPPWAVPHSRDLVTP